MAPPGRRRGLDLPLAALVLGFLLPTASAQASAQAASNGTNGSNGSSNSTGNRTCTNANTACCSTNIRREAYLACKEVAGFGLSDQICNTWMDYAEADCKTFCGNCTNTALAIYSQCIFYLGLQIPFSAAFDYCSAVRSYYEFARCPSACINTGEVCYSDMYEPCQAMCGNYWVSPGAPSAGCDCYQQRDRYQQPDVCTGDTILKGVIPGSGGLQYSCNRMPRDCLNHYAGTKCGKFTYCPVDVCIVRNVSCPRIDDCQSQGLCNRYDGKCLYFPRPDGESCMDGINWTHADTCVKGTCVGIEDKCSHFSVDCSTPNPCLVPRRQLTYDGMLTNCDPGTGSCMFEPQWDDTPCASVPGGEIDGSCQDGLCIRKYLDKCTDRPDCPDFGACFAPALCDSVTGECIKQFLPEGTACDDGNPLTFRDQCIEGMCIGDLVEAPTFQTLGKGDCVSHVAPAGKDQLPVRRYYRDTEDSDTCAAQCKRDPQCTAFSYGTHTCSIYGTTRTMDPDPRVLGVVWKLDTTASFVAHEVICWKKTQGEVTDILLLVRKYLMGFTFIILIGAPIAFFVARYWEDMRSSYHRMCGIHGTAVGELPSPRLAGAVTQGTEPAASTGASTPSEGGGAVRVLVPLAEGDDADGSLGRFSSLEERTTDPRGEVAHSRAMARAA